MCVCVCCQIKIKTTYALLLQLFDAAPQLCDGLHGHQCLRLHFCFHVCDGFLPDKLLVLNAFLNRGLEPFPLGLRHLGGGTVRLGHCPARLFAGLALGQAFRGVSQGCGKLSLLFQHALQPLVLRRGRLLERDKVYARSARFTARFIERHVGHNLGRAGEVLVVIVVVFRLAQPLF